MKLDLADEKAINLHKRRKFKMGLSLKVTALLILLIVSTTLISNYILYNLSYNALKNEIKDKLEIIASNAVVSLDIDKLKTIKSAEDEQSQAYQELQSKLQQIQKASQNKVRYIYTVAKYGDAYKYVLDATPVGDKDHSTVGGEFPISDFPTAAKGFVSPVTEDEPTYDAEVGLYSQSGYVPIKDKDGSIVGMLGVDMDVTTLKQEESGMIKAGALSLLSCLVLALFFALAFAKYLTKPILTLVKGTKSIAAGDMDTVVSIKRKDEFGELADSFNSMTQDLKESHDSLKRYSLELEDTVEKRTASIRNLMNNAGQGFMSFGSDLCVLGEYSLECKRIFDKDIALTPFHELIYPDNEEEKDATKSVLEGYFGEKEEIAKQSLLWLMPDEVTIDEKVIQLAFTPIFDPVDHSEQLMVILTDITEKKQLENQMEEERTTLKMVVKVVTQINDFIAVKKDFEYFYQSKINQILDSNVSVKEKILQIFKDVHTFKGNFGIFVNHVVPKLHELESRLAKFLDQEQELSLEKFKLLINEYDFSTWLDEDMAILVDVLGNEFLAEHSDDAIYIERNKVIEFVKKVTPLFAKEEDKKLLDELKRWLSKPFSNMLKYYVDYVGKLAERSGVLLHPVQVNTDEILVNSDAYNDFTKSLVHIFRNAIVHAIESPEERIEAEKDEYGSISCEVKKNNDKIVLSISDDGRGIDPARIRAKAIEKGLCNESEAEQLTDEEIIQFIFKDEFSTREEVSELAGRGVGLSAVKQEAERLGGSVEVKTVVGQGTTFEFLLPVL